MSLSENAIKNHDELLPNHKSGFKETDPEFIEFFDNFAFDEVLRNGLSLKDRELITFSMIASLGGCESQLRGHTIGNLNVGNDKQTLVNAVTILCPYIGCPRTLNALNIINEICK